MSTKKAKATVKTSTKAATKTEKTTKVKATKPAAPTAPVVQVLNIKDTKAVKAHWLAHPGQVVYIGRGTVYGNPYRITKKANREAVVLRYRSYLWKHMHSAKSHLRAEVLRLADRFKAGESLYLCCHCAPARCHGDILAKAIQYFAENEAPTG